MKGADLRGGKPDTYVQVYLLPGTHKELKTKVVNNNNNPVFQETMKFQIPQEKIHDRSIVLHVMDKDKFSKDDKMGEVQIQLNKVDLSRKASVRKSKNSNVNPNSVGAQCTLTLLDGYF